MEFLFYLRLIGFTAGSLLHLFLFVLLAGLRRPRLFESCLFLSGICLFLFYSGGLLDMNLQIFYSSPPLATHRRRAAERRQIRGRLSHAQAGRQPLECLAHRRSGRPAPPAFAGKAARAGHPPPWQSRCTRFVGVLLASPLWSAGAQLVLPALSEVEGSAAEGPPPCL